MKPCLKASLLAALVLAGPHSRSQTVSTGDQTHARLRAVGEKLKCQCGSGCAYTVGSCNMLNCHFREEVYGQIREDLKAGVQEAAILGKLKKKYGTIILAAPPVEGFGTVGWLMPFLVLGAGLLVVRWVILRWKRARAAAPAALPTPAMERFRERMEQDLADLE